MTATEIQGEIKAMLRLDKEHNSNIWALAKKLDSQFNTILKLAVKDALLVAEVEVKAKVTSNLPLLTPEERADELAKLLDNKLVTGEITASEIRELKDIFNLKAKDQDIHIQMIDYRSIDHDNADVVAAVKWQIMKFNEERSDLPTNPNS